MSLSVKKVWKSVNIWWSYGQEFGVAQSTADTIASASKFIHCEQVTKPKYYTNTTQNTHLLVTSPNVNHFPQFFHC